MTSDTQSAEVVRSARISDDELRNLVTHQDALALLQQFGGVVVEDFADDYGDGFELLKDKGALIGVPFIVVDFRFIKSDKVTEGGEFVAAHIITNDNKKYIVIDGSTGIFEQFKSVWNAREAKGIEPAALGKGLVVRGGLRKSDYQVTDAKGNKSSATTFYLAN